jgi:methyltransferase
VVGAYPLLLVAVALERVAELLVARAHTRWARAHGAVEWGSGHYPVMVLLHATFLVGCVVEGAVRPFVPMIGWTMFVLVVGAQALRWWVITTLGPRWNTRVFVVPGLPRVTGGPFRWLRHPNYVAVVVEGFALPLVHGAWVTALVFTIANALLLAVRIRIEDAALSSAEGAPLSARAGREGRAGGGGRMTDVEVLAGITEVARVHLGHEAPLTLDTQLVEALRLDSLRLLTLVVEVEDRFQVVLEDGDEATLVTAGDLVALIRRRRGT